MPRCKRLNKGFPRRRTKEFELHADEYAAHTGSA